jgi:hypothetical protein
LRQLVKIFISFAVWYLGTVISAKAQLRPGAGISKFETAASKSSTDTGVVVGNKRKLRKDNSISIKYSTIANLVLTTPDSDLSALYRYPTDSLYCQNLGNFISTPFSLVYNAPVSLPRDLGVIAQRTQILHAKDVPFYSVSKPYTVFAYYAGAKQLQGASILHTQDLKARGNFALHYRKLGSPGYFQGQRTTQDIASISLAVLHKSMPKLSTKIALAFTQNQQDENGGVLADSLLYEAGYNIRSAIPTLLGESASNRSNITSNYRYLNGIVQHQYQLYGKDSTAHKNNFKLQHQLLLTMERYSYKDIAPKATNYASIDTFGLAPKDSVTAGASITTIQNEFGCISPVFKKSQMRVEANYGLEVQRYVTAIYKSSFVNQYIRASAQGLNQQAKWQSRIDAQFYFSGASAGNLMLAGKLSKSVLAYQLQFLAEQHVYSPGFLTEQFVGNHYSRSNDFSKISHTILGGQVNTINQAYRIKFLQHTIYNMVYWRDSLAALQYSKAIPLAQLFFVASPSWQHWQWSNEIVLQLNSKSVPLNLPILAARHAMLQYPLI